MLLSHYLAKDEFELYGNLLRDVAIEDFVPGACRMVSFRKQENGWGLWKEIVTNSNQESGDFYQEMKKDHFVIMLGSSGCEVSFACKVLSMWGEFHSGRVIFLEFEDLNPNE